MTIRSTRLQDPNTITRTAPNVCSNCGHEPIGEQYFCTRCGTSLICQVNADTTQSDYSPPQAHFPREEKPIGVVASDGVSRLDIPLPARVAEQKILSRNLPSVDLGESIAGQDILTAAWAASVRMDPSGLSSHLIPGTCEQTFAGEEEVASPQNVRTFVKIWKLRRGTCYLVVASVLLATVITWAACWK